MRAPDDRRLLRLPRGGERPLIAAAGAPDESRLLRALGELRRTGTQAVPRPPADFARAVGSARRGFRLDVYEDARGETLASRGRRIDAATAARALARFARGDPSWAEGLSLGPATSAPRERPGAAGLLALAVFGAPVVALRWLAADGLAGVSEREWRGAFGTVAALAAYIGWLDYFFRRLRPRLGRRLGARLGVRVEESLDPLDAGTWSAEGADLPRSALVFFCDALLLVAATFAPIALAALAAFLLFEGGG